MGTMSAEEFSVRESLLVNRMWGRGSTATYQNPRGPPLSTSSAVAPLWSTQIKVSHAYFVSFSDAKKQPPNGGNQLHDDQEHAALRPSGTSHGYYYYWLLWQHPVTSCVLARSVVSHSLQPQDCSLPGFSVYGTSQARILEWVSFSLPGIFPTKGSNQYPLHWLADSLSLSHLGACGLIINQSENWPGADYVPHTTPSLFGLWRCFPETPGGVSGGFLSISPAFFSDGPVINFSLFQTPTSQFVWLHCSVGSGTCLQQQGLYQNF